MKNKSPSLVPAYSAPSPMHRVSCPEVDACFTHSHAYRTASPGIVHEPGGLFLAEEFCERHVQCLWFDPSLRPTNLVTAQGEPVEVVHPGSWNLEAGPDFHGAVVRVGTDRRQVQGDCEIHIHPAGWREHEHAADPRYARVRLHVTWYPGTLPEHELPPGCLQISMQDHFRHRADFHFDSIDLARYPYNVEAALTPIRQKMETLSPAEREGFLDAAGEDRLRRKAQHLVQLIQSADQGQALYEELMTALGYKANKAPFRALARCLPLHELRENAQGDPTVAYALLLGASGLMPSQPPQGATPEERVALRRAWDIWWKMAERWNHRKMSGSEWVRHGLRPPNHPERRMKAAATLFTRSDPPDRVAASWNQTQGRRWIKQALDWLDISDESWWVADRFRSGPVAGRSLLGRPRASAMITNVLVPFAAAAGHQEVFQNGLLHALPPEPINSTITETAHALFGPDHSSSLYKTALRRQGLIQIFHDYGLR